MNMKPNPDDRSDNVERIQENIDNTVENIRQANDMIKITSNEQTRQDLIDKNERREDALSGLRHEIKEEADARERGYS